MKLSSNKESRLLDLVDEALGIEPNKRSSWLLQACGDDHGLRREAEALLGYSDDAADLLQLSNAAGSGEGGVETKAGSGSEVIGDLQSGDQLGDYRIEKQIGAGGMAVVYQATQISLNRTVALKVLPPYLRNSPNALARFQREMEAAARLQHDNIVAVYATGDDGVNSYYAMQLIDGPALSEVLTALRHDPTAELRMDSPLPKTKIKHVSAPLSPGLPNLLSAAAVRRGSGASTPTETRAPGQSGGSYFEVVAGLLADVADGLDFAHCHQVVHRDIKPSNLLLSNDGRLHVGDFGLARLLAEPGMTQTGEFVGTPYYMAPEQIDTTIGNVDGRSDVYALGATLYEMLTLRPPFPGNSRDEVLACITSQEPLMPKRINKHVPRDLETICLKALEKNPERRYPTAGEMADDLRCFVAKRPITARRSGIAARGLKWCRRHPSMAASLLAACSLGVVAAALAYNAHESTKDKFLAEQQRDVVAARANKIEQDLNDARAAVHRAMQTEQERVFETALIAGMQGDQNAVETAIRQAHAMGASADRLHVLRAQNALFTADFDQGLEELEAAINLMPENFAAHALLAETHARLEQWETSRAILNRVRTMEPSSVEDLLLKGRMESYHDSSAALQTLDLAIARDKKNIAARLIRGVIRAKRAYDDGNSADAERALKDFQQASTFLEETPYLLSELLSIHLTAAAAYDVTGQQDARQDHLEQASLLVAKLENYPEDYQAHRWRAYYFDQVGDLEQSIADWQAIKEKTIGFLALALYRAGRFEEALQECDHYEPGRITGTSDFCHSFVLAASCSSDEQLVADFKFDTVLAWNRNTARRSAYTLWCLAGKPDRARQEVRSIGIADQSEGYDQDLYEFVCGEITVDEYLDGASASRSELARAHLAIGMGRLARGERLKARQHFQQVLDFRLDYEFFTAMSRALLVQLDRVPDWPPWIPVQ